MKVVLGAFRLHPRFAVLGLIGLCSLACGAVDSRGGADGGQGGSEATAGSANRGGTAGGGDGSVPTGPSKGGPKLRLLTQSEYKHALTDLLGTISAPLALPADTTVAGFVSIGASQVAVDASAVALYETTTLAATAEVFADEARWQKLVGCQPKADLSDACVVSFIRRFGKRAYRRELAESELQRWLHVGQDIAQLPGSSAAQGLSTIVSGMLQSLNFLYRVEINKLDRSTGRLQYNGASMATRLAFLLTGGPPSDELLAAAEAGQLETAAGVRTAAEPLLNDPSAVGRMAEFFSELSQAQLVSVAKKSPQLFPSFNAALQSSMLQATQLFIQNIVLAPGADVRSIYDSDQTFVDATLAPIYGVSAPASGFTQIKLGPEAARAGILGQAAVIAGHSEPDRSSPARRGMFILENFLCQGPPPPPPGVNTSWPTGDPALTTRQEMEQLVAGASCAACHAPFDSLGYALEHFDSIGQYRATERGLPIDASGTLDGVAFDGEAELGAVLRQNSHTVACLISNYYRDANGLMDAAADSAQIDALAEALTSHGYVWRDLVADFVASDAFRSAPVVLPGEGNQ